MQTAFEIRKYGGYGDHWGVYEDGELLCVTVYRKGAQAVVKRVSELADRYGKGDERMFQTEDLPLFSGTPMQVRASAYAPKPEERQARFGACPLCFDTGRTKVSGDGLCLCEKGETLRRQESIERHTR